MLLVFVCLSAAAAGCGQKGDLYLEPETAPAAGEDSEEEDDNGDG